MADFDWAVGINREVLKIIGLWFYKEESRLLQFVRNLRIFVVVAIIAFGGTWFQTLTLIKIRTNLNLIIDNLIVNLPVTVTIIKFYIVWCNRNVLADVFEDIEKDWLEEKKIEEKYVMIEFATMARNVTKLCHIFIFISLGVVFSPVLFGFNSRAISNITDHTERVFYIESFYFNDMTSLTGYYFVLLCQLLASYVSSTTSTAIDVCLGMAVLHSSGQLKILASRIQIMADEPENRGECIKNCIKKHCRLIGFIQKIETIFNLVLFTIFGAVAIIICGLEYLLIGVLRNADSHVSLMDISFYIEFWIYFTAIIFFLSWVGENLVTQSEALHRAACDCNWTSVRITEAMYIKLILLRSQYTLQITVGHLFPLSFNTFISIMKTSAGYVSFLMAV